MFFYGNISRHTKVHMGDLVLRGRGRVDEVETFCGHVMTSWEPGQQPPGDRAGDFCRNCFRAYAWRFMVNSVTAAVMNSSFAQIVETTINRAEAETWDSQQLTGELRTKLLAYQHQQSSLLTPETRAESNAKRPR